MKYSPLESEPQHWYEALMGTICSCIYIITDKPPNLRKFIKNCEHCGGYGRPPIAWEELI